MEARLARAMVLLSPSVTAWRAASGSPASSASAWSVWSSRVQTVAAVNASSSKGKSALSVRLAARITWKRASATSRNSERRGRASRSCSAWVRIAKCASAITASSPRSHSIPATARLASRPPFNSQGDFWKGSCRSPRRVAVRIAAAATPSVHAAIWPVRPRVRVARATMAIAARGRGEEVEVRKSLRLTKRLRGRERASHRNRRNPRDARTRDVRGAGPVGGGRAPAAASRCRW